MEVHLTLHAARRLKERLGIKSKSEKQRMAELAFNRGKFIRIDERDRFGITCSSMILEYQDKLFVFSSDRSLITVLPGTKKAYDSKKGLLSMVMIRESKAAIACA